jgi:hypothetical protein
VLPWADVFGFVLWGQGGGWRVHSRHGMRLTLFKLQSTNLAFSTLKHYSDACYKHHEDIRRLRQRLRNVHHG